MPPIGDKLGAVERILNMKGHPLRNMMDPEIAKRVFPLARNLGLRVGREFTAKPM